MATTYAPRQTPTFEANIPEKLTNDGQMATRLATAYFGDPMPWQPHLIDVMLSRTPQDKYAASVVGISIPRQNGKSWSVRARCFYGALTGERILYTCHQSDTADEMFNELKDPFENEENTELHQLLACVRKVNGQQAIYLKNGGCIRFNTRTDKLTRGKTFDVLIYDEAQELTEAQQAASLPAISAGKKKNPQTIYLGTPPGPSEKGTVFKKKHREVHDGKSNIAWMEWAAKEIGDKHDRSRWYECNPSLGLVLNVIAIEGEAEGMEPDTFARERLGWWAPPVAETRELAISALAWEQCCVSTPPTDGKLAFGVRFGSSGKDIAVSWALAERGKDSYVELYNVWQTHAGVSAIAEMLLRNAEDIAAVCIDGRSGADALIQRLKDGAFPRKAIIPGTASIAQTAASMLLDEVESQTLQHIKSPALDESATQATRRTIGRDGGWGFDDGLEATATPIESAALALYAARTTKRDPRRTQEANY